MLAVLLPLLLLLTNNEHVAVASQTQQPLAANGAARRRRSLNVVSPADLQAFHNSSVPLDCRVTDDDGANGSGTVKICWKYMPDDGCVGLFPPPPSLGAASSGGEQRRQRQRAALEASARGEPYAACSDRPIEGMLALPSSCWLLQFDLVDFGSNNRHRQSHTLLETQFRSIEVVTVDSLVRRHCPDVVHVGGGMWGIINAAVRSMGMGMGMVLEFGLGRSTVMLAKLVTTKDEVLHSFDSLVGLPEDWRPGFEIGKFSLGGTVPSDVRHLSNVKVHTGWVNETLPPFLLGDDHAVAPVGLLFLDLCLESGTAFVLDALACQLGPGSVVLFGNYFNYPDWIATPGERSAWTSVVDRWGIEFEALGFYSTFYLVKIKERPRHCPNAARVVVDEQEDAAHDPAVREWAESKIQRALEDVSGIDPVVRELEEVIAVDPTNAEALGYLAFALEDPYRIEDRFDYAHRALAIQHRMPPQDADAASMLASLHKKRPSFEPKFDLKVRKHRLRHDLEQLRYLHAGGRLPPQLAERAIEAYEGTLEQLADAGDGDMVKLSWSQWAEIGPYFNRLLYVPVLSRVRGGALNPAVNFTDVQAAYNGSDPHVVVVDDFLSPEALEKLLRYYREATVFYGVNHAAYVGTYLTDGLGNPVLAQAVEEIVQKLRPILCDRPLVQAWVYKYDDRLQRGINIHADSAAVNFNLWLGENESVDPGRGGLVIFTRKPPEDWDFGMYNTDPPAPEVLRMLEESGYKNTTVPYRQNRMIMFDSKLFHVSDVARWRPGYKSRRINLTLLFGRMGSSCDKQ